MIALHRDRPPRATPTPTAPLPGAARRTVPGPTTPERTGATPKSPPRPSGSVGRLRRGLLVVGTLLLGVALAACAPGPQAGPSPAPEETATPSAGDEATAGAGTDAAASSAARHDPPAPAGAMAPQLAAARGGGAWLSWLEPAGDDGHRLRVARFGDDGWSTPATVAEGDDFFANWADVPSVAEGADGTLLAHWLARIGEGTYAYGVRLARSTDGGATWAPLGLLHDDDSATEHGFATLLPDPSGGFRAFWLDGRAMADGGPMQVRATRVEGTATAPETVLDDRVCECCQTSAALTTDGPLVVYRNRSAEEVRDIFSVRRTAGGWSEPAPVHADGWRIPGCPVNGPAVAARDGRAVVAWFTAAGDRPRVHAAFSADGGATWSPPVLLDDARPLGRVDADLLADGTAAVSWLGGDGAVQVAGLSPDGGMAGPLRLGVTSTARASGFPRIELDGSELHAVWVEVDDAGDATRLRFATLEPPVPAAP